MSNSKTYLISFLAGMIFALGLIISNMVDPNKVVAFLRIFDRWDASLALVMGGAIAVAMPAFMMAKRKANNHQLAYDGNDINLPNKTAITPQLIVGSIMFGVGWGLVGFCPAPALVSALAGYGQAVLFLAAMVVGFWGHSIETKS